MNNNIDIANFDKMLELAEFGAKRHNERRQNLFKFVISYITLLVLALYQTFKTETLLELPQDKIGVVVLLLVVHCFFLVWLWATLKALINDVRRRDFYLKKAELLSYHLSKNQFSDFSPHPCESVILNLGSGRNWKITERRLFNKKSPPLITGESPCKQPPDSKWFSDIHFWTLAIGPTGLVVLVVVKLLGGLWTGIISLLGILFLLITELLNYTK